MGSLYGTCEIVEAKEDLGANDYSKRSHQARVNGSERKPPLLKQGYGKALEDDIDKLFEGINIRTSFNGSSSSEESGVGMPRKNPSKKPMRMSTSSASGIGFSEPVSLKQALRGLCISQASEMAALKRLSKPPGSPALSDSGRLANMYRSGVLKASEFGSSSSATEGKEAGKFETSILPEESTSYSVGKVSHYLHESKMKSNSSSVHPSPQLNLEMSKKRVESTSKQEEIVPVAARSRGQPAMMEPVHEQKKISVPSPSCNTTDDAVKSVKDISASVKLVKKCDGNVSKPSKLGNKAAPKLRRKERLHGVPSSSSVNNIKFSKSTRNSPRSVKPVKAVIRNKNLVKKKPKHVPASDTGTAHSSNGVNVQLVLDTSQLICQRCQCNMNDARKEPSKGPAVPLRTNESAEFSFTNGNPGSIRQGSIPSSYNGSSSVVVKSNSILKSGDKGEFTQSSNSSLGEYSSSTSISEESTLSCCTVGNRPHMSKDMRWHAINHVMKQNGFLGLRHFNLLKKLGCGDIGTVYLAELMGTNCPFAIKVMDNEFLERRKKMPRAHCEREILKILDHPFLPTLYAHFVSENLSCLVMEYCPGGDLHVLRQKQPNRYFHEQAARFYVAEVLLALEYLHMLGIVYRDLKPENILVREDGHIMLTDFDLSLRCSVNPTLLQSPSLGTLEPPRMSGPCAGSNCIDPFCIKPTCQVSCFSPRILPSAKGRKQKPDLAIQNRLLLPQLVAEPTDARSNSFVGTHEYLAPEIIKGDGHGSAVDWWTFGIFLYELLYGKTPFKGAGNDETLANVVLQSLKFPETPLVSLQARDLIRGLLVKEPEHRLGSERGAAEIKQHPFFEGLNWALIRCAIPPELPETYDIRVPKKYLDYNGSSGGHLEFELF